LRRFFPLPGRIGEVRRTARNEVSGDPKGDAHNGTMTCQCGKKTIPITGKTCVNATYLCGPRCAFHHRGLRDAGNIAFKQRLERFVDLPTTSRRWFDLAKEVGIDPIMVNALAEVVSAYKWKESASPRRYLRTTTERRFNALHKKSLGIYEPFDGHGQRKFDKHSTCFSELPVPTDDDGNIQNIDDFVDQLAMNADEEEGRFAPPVPKSLRDYETVAPNELRRNALLFANLQSLNAVICGEYLKHLKRIPELTEMLDDGMLEAALAVSRGFTYRHFLENGAWWAVGTSAQKTSTAEERRNRQAAWRRLSRMKKSSPSLRRMLEKLATESRRYMYETPAQKRKRKQAEADVAPLPKMKEAIARGRHNTWQLENDSQSELRVEHHIHLPVEPKPTLFAGIKPACRSGHTHITESAGRQRCRDCGEWLGNTSHDYEDVLVVASRVPTADQT
jgi:hypothetical protein